MGDALAIALMEVRDFKPRDFAQFHPGGELGKRLLTTARDVMRTEDMPVIPPTMHLGEAIIHVSKGKLGLGVAEIDGKIVGLITDGDIRRAMEKWQAQFFDRTVADIMTRKPKVVPPSMKISDIQSIMNKYKVHSVLVVDDDNHLLGVVEQGMAEVFRKDDGCCIYRTGKGAPPGFVASRLGLPGMQMRYQVWFSRHVCIIMYAGADRPPAVTPWFSGQN